MYRRTQLPSGLTVITERISSFRSVAVGILVGAGSKNETASQNGISHFLEHMNFKGTGLRSALQIAETIDAVGGRLNAYTTKEYTNFYAVVLEEHRTLALELLSDIFLNSLYRPQDIAMEKEVVSEEIKMYEDTPDEKIHDLFISNVWPNTTLGQPVIGNSSVLNTITTDVIRNYYEQWYTPENVIISAAGALDHDEWLEQINTLFGAFKGAHRKSSLSCPILVNNKSIISRPSEQVHLCIGCQGLSYHDPKRYALSLLGNILGGAMSSRLFQEIREKRGLAYSIYAYQSFYKEAGLFTVYAGTSLKNVAETTELIMKEIKRFYIEPIDDYTLHKAKEQFKGNLVLGLESVSSRMNWNSKAFFYYQKKLSVDDIFERVASITSDDIRDLAMSLFQQNKFSLTAVGPFDDKTILDNVF